MGRESNQQESNAPVKGEGGGCDDLGVQWTKAKVVLCSWASVLCCLEEIDKSTELVRRMSRVWTVPLLSKGIFGAWRVWVALWVLRECWLKAVLLPNAGKALRRGGGDVRSVAVVVEFGWLRAVPVIAAAR